MTPSNGVALVTDRTTNQWPSAVRLTAGGVLRHRLYAWDDNGMLTARESPGRMDERYTYDDLGQLVTVVDAVSGADQAYAYDPAGNVTSMTDIDGTLWTYGAATDRNQVPWREELFGVQREEFTYDASGRVATQARTHRRRPARTAP